MKNIPLRRALYSLRHIAIPVLVYSTELAAWAVLNHYGLGDRSWQTWRISLLSSLTIVCMTAVVFFDPNSKDVVLAAAGVTLPWLVMVICGLLYGFIKMDLSFLTPDWFFWGVLVSGVAQVLIVILVRLLK